MGIPRSYRRSTQPNLRDLCRSDRSSASSYKNVHRRKNVRAGRQSAFTSPSSDSSGRLWVRLRATVCFELSRYRNIRWHGSRDTYASCRPKISGGRGGAGCQLELSFRQMEITGSLCPLVSLLGCSPHRAPPSRDYHTTRASFTRRLVKSRARRSRLAFATATRALPSLSLNIVT